MKSNIVTHHILLDYIPILLRKYKIVQLLLHGDLQLK